MKIGLVIHNKANILSNGLTQNAYFIYVCLKKCGYDVTFLCHELNPSPFPLHNIPIYSLNDANFPWASYNVIITCTRPLNNLHYEFVKKNSIKIISFICGNHLYVDCESFISGKKQMDNFHCSKPIDCIWIIPSFFKSSSYYQLWDDVPIYSVPHLWCNEIILYRSISLSGKTISDLQYRLKSDKKISIWSLESNLNACKTSLLACSVSEYLFENHKDKFMNLCITNKNKHIDLYSNNLKVPILNLKTYLEIDQIFVMMNESNSFPIIVCHQFYTSLNYLYYEALSFGFPLVHNSNELKNYGYYYEDDDLFGCVEAVLRAYKTHNKTFQYIELPHIDPYNKSVQCQFQDLLSKQL